jgi:hypothetical protein
MRELNSGSSCVDIAFLSLLGENNRVKYRKLFAAHIQKISYFPLPRVREER